MTDPSKGMVTHFRVELIVFENTVNYLRNTEQLPKGLTLGRGYDLLQQLLRSEPVVEVDPSANDLDAKLANENEESS